MNKQTRLIVSVLFIGIIVLAVAITRFYSRTEKSAVSNGSQTIIEKKLGFDSAGNRAFQNSEGLVGIIDSSEHVIVSPEWQTIKFTSNSDRCIASKHLHNKEMYGCIDYEGNIVVPFVYSDIKQAASPERVLYIARTDDKKSSVVYNSNFDPCFSRAWDNCSYANGELSVTSGSSTYTYHVTSSEFIFDHAVINGTCKNCPYSMKITAQGLTIPMMEKIRDTVEKYLEFAYEMDDAKALKLLDELGNAPENAFRRLFPDEKNITLRKLIALTEISVQPKESNDKIPHYEASVTADTGIIYKDQNNQRNKIRDDYKAVIEFTGSSDTDLKAVSGAFEQEKPNYHETEPEPETQPDVPQGALPQEN
ncbi:WG repeat-containing protein [Ruminococcus flavefaciens]|uniref:WG repeat-containing protein n=1 Tax=Ruminococcus flavefaciens TaxID=1265 RepID=UPI0026EE7EE4|nr:WG repeat-containing protein [Ruminococcus flavefaciens]